MVADPIGYALLAWEWRRDPAGNPAPPVRGPGWHPGVALQVP